MQFRVIVGNRPTHIPTNRQDRLQYTAPQLARSVINRCKTVVYTFRRAVGRDVTDNGHVFTGRRGHEHVTGNSVGRISQADDIDTVET